MSGTITDKHPDVCSVLVVVLLQHQLCRSSRCNITRPLIRLELPLTANDNRPAGDAGGYRLIILGFVVLLAFFKLLIEALINCPKVQIGTSSIHDPHETMSWCHGLTWHDLLKGSHLL